MSRMSTWSAAWGALAAAGVWVYLCFHSGAFFAGAVGVGVVLLCAWLALRLAVVRRPLVGVGRLFAIALAGMAALAAWTLLSSVWSHAPARAVSEFDRTLLYLVALLAGGLLFSTPARLATALRFAFAALVVVCACGLTSRVAPDVWHQSQKIAQDRLSYPISYWNGLGLLAAIAVLLGIHYASTSREPAPMRVLGAASVPVSAATLYFTFSRGAIAAGAIALGVYLVVARPRSLPLAAVTAGPAAAITIAVAYHADLLATFDPTGPAAQHQGHHVALAVALCAGGAAAARAALLPLDRRLDGLRIGRRASALGAAAAVVLLVVVALAAGLPSKLSSDYRGFVHGGAVIQTGDFRSRLADPSSNGRLEHWRVALKGFRSAPVAGHGAGTYELEWAQRRPEPSVVLDAHSLYLETLDELGIVGLVLLLVPLVAVLLGSIRGLRGPNRPLAAALVAVAVAWVAHAGVDWDWELPAVSWWFFLLGGGALASTRRADIAPTPGPVARIAGALALVALAATPALAALSQTRLDNGLRDFARGNCAGSIDQSLAATRWLSQRPEPYLLRGYCDMRMSLPQLAVGQMQAAARRDPRNWLYRYGLAVARGRAGLDPRPDARAAALLNPRSPLARRGVRLFSGSSPARWRRAAKSAPLPLPA